MFDRLFPPINAVVSKRSNCVCLLTNVFDNCFFHGMIAIYPCYCHNRSKVFNCMIKTDSGVKCLIV